MEQPQTPAASTPTPAPVSAQSVLESLSSEEHGTWAETGELPDRVQIAPAKPSDVPAASSAASTPSTETPAASSPATPGEPVTDDKPASSAAQETTPQQKRTGHKGNADTRIQQLLLENARLQGQLENQSRQAPKPDAPAASSAATAPTQQDWKRIMAQPDAPKEADFDSFAEFTAAASYHVTHAVLKEHQARGQAETAIQREVSEIQTVASSAAERVAAHAQTHPDFVERVDPRLLNLETASVRRLKGEKVGPQHLLAEETLKSPAVVPLLEHFSTPEGQREWRDLLSKPPSDLLRAFGRLEARFDPANPSAPTPKTVSSAPAPPVTLGTRPADTADALERAIKSKDTAAYIREANKRDLAAMGL